MATDKSFAGNVTRLRDPHGVADSPRQFQELADKISSCMTRLFQFPKNGGNPFLFSLAGPKAHYLVKNLHGREIPTAATDGKHFYWNPSFLESLDSNQVQTLMSHESYHVFLFHCGRRSEGKNPRIWNAAIDYVVNSIIEHDHVQSGRDQKFKLWGGALGDPLTLQGYLDYLAGQDIGGGIHCWADISLYGRSPESIYDEVHTAELASVRRCKEQTGGCGALSIDPKTGQSIIPAPWDLDACQKCGAKPNYGKGPMDSHIPCKLTKDEVMGEMMRAAERAAATGRGTAPDTIVAALRELKQPTLRPSDIVRHAFQRKAIDVGTKNDWKRFSRRAMSRSTPQYIPKKHDYFPKWVVLLDTSGSMSDRDIANGLKEMQAVPKPSEGWVVPCDATPHWDQKTLVKNTQDLKRTKVVGRGGTVFDEFFRDLPTRIGRDIDVVVIISDGDCGNIPANLRPPCDVLWVITNNRDFKPSFGRVVQLAQT